MKVNLTRLKAINYANLVLVLLWLVPVTIMTGQDLLDGRSAQFDILLSYPAMGCLATHTLLILYIQKRHYPNKEIPKALKTWVTVFAVLCGIMIVFMVLAVASLIIVLVSNKLDSSELIANSIGLTWFTLACILFSLQISTGNRLITVIQNNYRRELENSIA